MFRSLTTKILFFVAVLVVVQAVGLSLAFLRVLVRQNETLILEILSRRVESQKDSLRGLKDPISEAKNFQFVTESASYGKEVKNFHFPDLKKILPPEGIIVTPCQSNSGKMFFCAMSALSGTKEKTWVIDIAPKVSKAEILFQVLRDLWWMAVLLTFGFLTLGWLLSLRLMKPLKNFKTTAQAVAKGDYQSLSLPLERKDEIGDFANAFDRMISDLKDRERHLSMSALKLAHQERLASIGQIGASIAHEVKNPLTSMMGYAKILSEKIDPELKEAAEVISQEGERCQRILQQMLRFSRNDPLETKPYALKEVVETSLLLMKAEAKNRGVHLKAEIKTDPIIVGSPQQIQQVIMNLILNALQASPLGRTVSVYLEGDHKSARVRVQDEGPGIPKEAQEHLFEPFFTTKNQQEGTGLGLSVAAEIIKNQGGSISFVTEEMKGATFEMKLPIAEAS